MNENKPLPASALSKEDLLDIIQKGENASVEFYSADVNSDSLAKEMTAFSNSNGGFIFPGVEDSGSISGLKEGKTTKSERPMLHEIILSPPLTSTIEK
ncbi:MAG: ATP-binding protein [bacterium]|nr:ATP-binding protein [bacterium]